MHYLLNKLLHTDHQYLISSFSWFITVLGFCLISGIMIYFLQGKEQQKKAFFQQFKSFIFNTAKKPFLALILTYFIYISTIVATIYFPELENYVSKETLIFLLNIIETIIFFWFVLNAVSIGKVRLLTWSFETDNKTLNILIPAISSSIYTFLFLIMINILLPALNLPEQPEYILRKVTKVFLIGMVGWVFIQILHTAEKFITNQYINNNANLMMARKINTQLTVLKRILITIIFIIVCASILMMFESVKNLGTGLLTTAGIISAIGAFASQQSLSRLFAGLLIAFTQPIRIGDTIIIENELGQVEEITLSYIVIKLWDLRRLILPTDYFTDKGLQNLTRESSELLGTIFIYTDYTLPVETIRNKFFELLNSSQLWNKKVASFHVTGIKENSMQLRGLMSADNSSNLWELRCEIRERLMYFIVENYPDCLSKSRNVTTNVNQIYPLKSSVG